MALRCRASRKYRESVMAPFALILSSSNAICVGPGGAVARYMFVARVEDEILGTACF